MELSLIKGSAGATIYSNKNLSHHEKVTLTIDWSYDAMYFKYYTDDYITISLGIKTDKDEIFKIDTDEKKSMFKTLCFFAISKLKNYSTMSDKALLVVFEKADLFV